MDTSSGNDVVFLFDVDNTLLDNDHVLTDLRTHMTRQFGESNSARYWQLFEELRAELGYADYLGALQRYRNEHRDDTQLLLMSCYLIDYPFANRIFPGALDALRYASRFGKTAILSDGDVVFQPRKVSRCDHALPRASLRDGRRQAAHSHGDEREMGGAAYHDLSAPRPLRA